MSIINNLLDTKLKASVVGAIILISSIVLTLAIILGMILLISAGITSGVNPFALIPFVVLATTALIISSSSIYFGIQYLKSKPLKVNKALGTILIYFGVIYFLYTLFTYVVSNLTGNTGGEIMPAIAFVWGLISVPFGFALRNGCK